MYSLETWLPDALNKASRKKDKSKISTLGPFALMLSTIMQMVDRFLDEEKVEVDNTPITVYRACILKPKDQDHFFNLQNKIGEQIQIHGYLNAMKNRNTAMRDALFLQQEGDLIILYEIELNRPHHEGRHYFDMSSPDHTLYPDED